MITHQQTVAIMYAEGRRQALDLQSRAETMTGTELNAETDRIPDFSAACKTQNMLERKAGFVCKSSAGRVVKLVQPYDSANYTQEPEELPAQWGFKWSTDPAKALPFVALSTSPYMTGDCCTENGTTFCSRMDNNVWPPSAYAAGWESVTITAPEAKALYTNDKIYSGLLED